MKLSHKNYTGRLTKTALLVVFAAEGGKPSLPDGVKLPPAALKDFKGEFRQARLTDALTGAAVRVLLVGLGKGKGIDAEKLRRAAAIGVQKAEAISAADASFFVDDQIAALAGGPAAVGCAITEGLVMGAYRYTGGKSQPKAAKLQRASTLARGAAFRKGAQRGAILGEANLFTRDLQNLAGNQLTPRKLAERAQAIARKSPRITCKVLDETALKKLGMGLLLGVSAGSREPARLIHLVYKPAKKARARIALVGKGLTFDAGGTSLKPGKGMEEMRYDMSGGAAVLGTFHALAALDVAYEVHGIVPASENLPDGQATKPGDIHTGMAGKTVEVINTDAEGRLILADALAYTLKKVKPRTIIDLATLTGAVIVGLGHEVTGMFATTDDLRDRLLAAGLGSGEPVWHLPLLEPFKENLAAGPADLRNICTPSMMGGSLAAAVFLQQFVEDVEWSHLDIAGTAWGQGVRDYVGGEGGTGVGTRLLVEYLSRK